MRFDRIITIFIAFSFSTLSSGFTVPSASTKTFVKNNVRAPVQRRTNGVSINMAEPQQLFDIASILPLAGTVVAGTGVLSALQIREAQKEEQEMKLEAIRKAAEEQDARNRAAAAGKKKQSSTVSYQCPV